MLTTVSVGTPTTALPVLVLVTVTIEAVDVGAPTMILVGVGDVGTAAQFRLRVQAAEHPESLPAAVQAARHLSQALWAKAVVARAELTKVKRRVWESFMLSLVM